MKKFTLSLILSAFALFSLQATVYTSVNDGNWSSPNNWSPVGIPDVSNWPGDQVIIAHNITSNSNITLNHQSILTIQSGASLSSNRKLTLSSSFSGVFTLQHGGSISCKEFKQSSPNATIVINGSLSCTTKLVLSGAATANFDNATIETKDFIINQSANTLINNSILTITDDLELSGSSVSTFNATEVIIGDEFELEGSAKSFFTDGSIQITEKLEAGGSTTISLMSTTLNVGDETTLSGSSKLTVNGDATIDLGDLTIEGSASIRGENTGGILAFNSIDISGSGAVFCSSNNCNFGAGSMPPSPLDLETGMQFLPVELLFFKAIQQENSVNLVWATATEKNNAFFEIEKSYDAKKWSTYEIIEGAINSNQRLNYAVEAILEMKKAHIYYRLKQVDLDGGFTYSNIEVIDNELVAANVSIYPNPTNGYFKVAATLAIQSIRIYSPQGQLIQVMKNEEEGQVGITLPNNLTKGYYYLQILTENGVESHQLLLE